MVDALRCELLNTRAFWRNPGFEVAKLEARSESKLEIIATGPLPDTTSRKAGEPAPMASRPLLATEMQNIARDENDNATQGS